MAGAVGQKLFEKKLTTTDLNYRLNWSPDHLTELPDFNGGHQVDFFVKDGGGKVWKFRCAKRMNGPYDKPVVSAGWVPFLKSKGDLKVGDQVIFYKSEDPHVHFEVRIKKNVQVFKVNFNDEEI